MIHNSEELFERLTNLVEKSRSGSSVSVCSYGMYLGISNKRDGLPVDYNGTYPANVRKFTYAILRKELPHRILINVPFFSECKPGCADCADNYNQLMDRYDATSEILGLNMRFMNGSHLKYYRVGDNAIVGGINFSTSGSFDVAVEIRSRKDRHDLNSYFDAMWTVWECEKASKFKVYKEQKT